MIEGTSDRRIGPNTEWKEYEWKCKPGDPMRRPCLITPYHYRLDWLIWFAAMASPDHYPFVAQLIDKLLQGDEKVLSLLEENPFPNEPPHAIRAELYRYEFSQPGDPSGAWWTRQRVGTYIVPLTLDDPRLVRFLEDRGFRRRRPPEP